jgi:type I restriction enzyme M protein
MLDATTKRNIDAARDVLVGKVPDPKAQVEQITTALIYKFMDDLDKESLRLGGKAKFFSGEYEKYSWSNLVDTRLSGEARLGLYVQAITSMDKNPSLPQLFRDIFKGAFLPYNDPQTLSLFVKEINKFTYNHSEELGNAFEYLLSIMSSQGAAGQFRTPRHIIDFMVAVVDPQKNETILDPACGTAGFLISSFKHIRKHNSSNFDENNGIGGGLAETANQTFLQDDPLYRGGLLTQDERRRLMENIQGYDISPDMVRLSLVNLYLHGFPSPNIFEYDTLSSEDRWNETFDVILANPPFMTPKGGIRPHQRFQVQAKRSEVLFVDYILEHLNVNGRAGIIVPEGIIFKTENAYKKLRKLLVEEGLYAVVSLPSGVFNPYAGVKTSILFFDKKNAKRTQEILFVKIEHDGFDLGAQRKIIDKNDLPEALKLIRLWKNQDKNIDKKNIDLVKKDRILSTDSISLSSETYKKINIQINNNWPLIELGNEEYFQIESGGTPRSTISEYWNGNISWVTLVDLPQEKRVTKIVCTERSISELGLENSSAKLLPEDSVMISSRATIGRIGVNKIPIATNQGFKNIIINDHLKVNSLFLAYYLSSQVEEMQRLGTGGTYKEISKSNIARIRIPLPPLEVQKEIVEQIEVKQAAIDAAKSVIENLEKERRYFGSDLKKLENVDWVCIGDTEIIKVIDGDRGKKYPHKSDFNNEGYCLFLNTSNVRDGHFNFEKTDFISRQKDEDLKKGKLRKQDIVFTTRGTVGNSALYDDDVQYKNIRINSGMVILRCNEKILNPVFFLKILNSYIFINQINDQLSGSAQPQLPIRSLNKIRIPIPDIRIQIEYVTIYEKLAKARKNNQELISLLEERIQEMITEI